MWPVFSYLPGGATISRVAIGIVARHGWKMLTHTAVAALAAWGTWTWATGDPVRKEVPAPEIPDIRVTPPDEVQAARETTPVMDTTCAAIPEGIVPREQEESTNGLPEVEYTGGWAPYITVEVTRQGPAVEVTPSAVTLQGYAPDGTLRSYRYERDRRRLSVGPYVRAISSGGRRSVAAGAEVRWDVSGRWNLSGRAGKLARPGWTGSLSLTYDLL
jgi:hypothetical protein